VTEDNNNTNRNGNKEHHLGTSSSIRHCRKIRYLVIIGIPTAIAVIALSVLLGVQANEQERQQERATPQMVLHIHPKLSIKVDGTNVTLPKDIGISPSLWKDHSLKEYGMPGMAPLHTHDDSGIIHVESVVDRNYTFDEFLDIWGLDLNDKAIQISANGKPVNSLDYVLNDGDNLIMEIKQQ
jgi:hypothetical protein